MFQYTHQHKNTAIRHCNILTLQPSTFKPQSRFVRMSVCLYSAHTNIKRRTIQPCNLSTPQPSPHVLIYRQGHTRKRHSIRTLQPSNAVIFSTLKPSTFPTATGHKATPLMDCLPRPSQFVILRLNTKPGICTFPLGAPRTTFLRRLRLPGSAHIRRDALMAPDYSGVLS